MDHADHARQYSEHAAFSAARHKPRRRRLGIQAAIARALLRVEDRRLTLEPEDRAVHIGLARQHARVVDQIAGGEVVGAVDDDVVIGEQLQRVLRREGGLVGVDLHVRIDLSDPLFRGVELQAADVCSRVNDLPLQVREVDHVEINDAQAANSRRSQIHCKRRA